MFVVKRDGHKEPVMFDKITARIKKLCYGLNPLVDPVRVSMRVIEGLYDGVTTSELDNLAAEIAATMTTTHPDYAQLAARISVSNLHKNTKKSFSETMDDLYNYVNPRTGKKAPLLSDQIIEPFLKPQQQFFPPSALIAYVPSTAFPPEVLGTHAEKTRGKTRGRKPRNPPGRHRIGV